LAKTNYNQAKRQKENARKARQQEKLAKKLARVTGDPDAPDADAVVGEATGTSGVAATEAPAAPTENKEAP
jgi:hypothetical protein